MGGGAFLALKRQALCPCPFGAGLAHEVNEDVGVEEEGPEIFTRAFGEER